MKVVAKIAYSENTKSVLAETKLEVEYDNIEDYNTHISFMKDEARKLFEESQNFALKQTLRRS
jgi:hypothetical protein